MKKIFTLIALHFALLSFAQAGSLDTSFNPTDVGYGKGDGANGIVYTTSLQPDGKILIGGNFTTYNGVARGGIARLNADGSLDTGFNPGAGADNEVKAILVQLDGKIIMCGSFTTYNGVSCNKIARLNADGSLDTGFNSGVGADDIIGAASLDPNGKIIIGGAFTNYNGISRNRIARLNTDGSLDGSFNPGTGANDNVLAISLQPDGKIIIGGDFTAYNNFSRFRITRLNTDGSLDLKFNPETGIDETNGEQGVDSTVHTILLQPNGKIIITGDFTMCNGVSSYYLARLNPDGSLDTSFNTGAGTSWHINTASLQSDGKIIIGGVFDVYNLTYVNGLARINSDGSLDTTFKPEAIKNVSQDIGQISCISLQSDGRILVGGEFEFCGMYMAGYTRLNSDGSLDTNFNIGTGANRDINVISLQSDNKILVGGNFTKYNGIVRSGIVRLNSDGNLDNSFNPGTGANGKVLSICVQKDGKIIIGGTFTRYNGADRTGIARLNADGSLDNSFNPGTGAIGTNGLNGDNGVYSILLQNDGKILIGGNFTSYNGYNRNGIVRLNSDGSLDASFNIGSGLDLILDPTYDALKVDGYVLSMSLQTDGKIIIGGWFSSYNGTDVVGIARLNSDGILDTSFSAGKGLGETINLETSTVNSVYTISLQPDGKIIIGGYFSSYNGTATKSLARLNTDGSLDTSFKSGTDQDETVMVSLVQPNGKIIVGGGFTDYNGILQSEIALLNSEGSLDPGFVDPGTDNLGYIEAMALQWDGKIIIGGNFTSVNGIGRNRIARINGDSSSLGTNENEFAKSIQLYPNPVSDILTIGTQEDIAPEVEIYDVLGKSVKALTSFDKRVDVSSLPSGVYIINVTGTNGVYKSKFIKK